MKTINELNEGEIKPIDMEKLARFAEGISLVCQGEYGYTYVNPETRTLHITLGDASPFRVKELEFWIVNSFYDQFDKIEIADEWSPKEEGYLQYKKGKFVEYK